jgi:monoterpene epsilon-lactone hydrolase
MMRDSRIPVELLVTDGGWHGFNWEPDLDEGIRARGAVMSFLRARLTPQ